VSEVWEGATASLSIQFFECDQFNVDFKYLKSQGSMSTAMKVAVFQGDEVRSGVVV